MLGLEPVDAIYMDYAATTPVAPEVIAAMQDALADFGNPSSSHAWGARADDHVTAAAAALGAALGVAPETLVWTSGATESDNLAIIGAARYRAARGKHVITSRTEHKAVIDACKQLEREGIEVTWLTPDADGCVTPAALAGALRDDTVLVSLMWVNNEIGTVNDISGLAAVMSEHDALFHVDAAQAFGKVPVAPAGLAIDLMSVTAHKCYGPKGVGALYVAPRHGVQFEPLLFGGGQQDGRRPGTLPVHQIAGFGRAAALVGERLETDHARLDALGRRLAERLLAVPGVLLNGSAMARLQSIVNVSVEGVAGAALVAAMQPIALATGSACNSRDTAPSFVLRALGRDDLLAGASLRFSLGRLSTAEDVDAAASRFEAAVTRLRDMAGDLARVLP
ncbi:MAG: cysteine desulfurase family protein [Pseudomonadota bacterium]